MTEKPNTNFYSAFTSSAKPLSWSQARKIVGRIGYAVGLFQLLLGVGSMLLFLLAMLNRGRMTSLGVDFSLFCVWCGLIFLAISICYAFNYSRIAKKSIKTDISSQKASVVKKLKIATMIGSAGTLVSFLGVEIILGVMFSIVLIPESGSLFNVDTKFPIISFAHISTIFAAANLMAANCAGLVASLYALNKIEKLHF